MLSKKIKIIRIGTDLVGLNDRVYTLTIKLNYTGKCNSMDVDGQHAKPNQLMIVTL